VTARVSRVRNRDGSLYGYSFVCPGCVTALAEPVEPGDAEFYATHVVPVAPSPRAWGFNGDESRPTFTPSILVRQTMGDARPVVCHSFVREGRIQFLGDCTHALAGQTVDLPVAPPRSVES
jgi:hypothetical protein